MAVENLAQWLENKVDRFLEETEDTIVGHYQDALRTNVDYRGRQLLELLQNADDAYDVSTGDVHKVYIELTDTQLIIKNTGVGFSKEGVESLLTSNLSPKDNDYIGNKGLGFRSILNWTKKIHIYSQSKENIGVWSFAFSREYAEDRFNSLPKEKQNKARQMAQNEVQYPIATLRCPKWEYVDTNDEYYTTSILLDIKKFAVEEIEAQIKKINENILVFLPHLTEIEIVYSNKKVVYTKIVHQLSDQIDEVLVEKNLDGIVSEKQWTLHHRRGKIELITENDEDKKHIKEKDFHLAVAYQADLSDDANHLFSFFSTEVPLHIPALVHGTFDLEGNRNKISTIDANKELLKKLSDLLIETAQYIAKDQEKASWDPLSLIYFNKDTYDKRLEELGFYTYLLESIKNSKLFPCHDGTYRSIENTWLLDDSTKFKLHRDIHEILSYEKFAILGNLLQYTESRQNQQLIETWRDSFDHSDDISAQFNRISSTLDESERVEVIYLVSEYSGFYGDEYLELLVDDHNDVIEKDIAIYTPKTSNTLDFEIPEHIKLRFMSQSLYDKLVEKFSSKFRDKTEADSRKLQAILKRFLNLHSYEPDPVIKKIISDTNPTDINEVKAMVKTLHIAFNSAKDTPTAIDIQVPLIDRNNQIIMSQDLYLGKPYRNGDLIETIYGDIEIKYLGMPSFMNLPDEEKLEGFFKWIGVNEYYKIKAIDINNNDTDPYITWFKERTEYNFKKYYPNFTVRATTVEHLTEIFDHNKLEDIVRWLYVSNVLEYLKTNKILFLQGSNRTNKSSPSEADKKNFSYLQWEIENLIPTKSNKRASTRNCILPDLNLDLTPVFETVKIDYKVLEDYGIERGFTKDILHQLGIYRDFDEISSATIEGILRDLYLTDPMGKQAKKLYRLILNKYSEYKNNELYRIKVQCNDIQVFCNKNGVKSYYPAKEAFYLDELVYPNAILKNYPLIDIGIRQGQSKIKHIFGVEPLKDLHISLDMASSQKNYLNIQDDIDSVKPYILALRLKQLEGKDQSKISKSIREMKVQLMSKLVVVLDGEKVLLDKFDYIYEGDTFYISTKHDSLEALRKDIDYIDLIPVLFSTVLKVTSDESKYKEIYKDRYNRKHILDTHTEYEADRYLDEAKKQLHIRSHKLEFWNDIALLMGIEQSVKEDTNINKFFQLTVDTSLINYENLSADKNYELLKSIFNDQITLDQFNQKSMLKIDFIPYYERKLYSEHERMRKLYKSYVWNDLNNLVINDQNTLKQRWGDYERIQFLDIENDFHFNIKEYFSQCLLKETGIDLDDLEKFEFIDFEKYYFEFRKDKEDNLLDLLWKTNDDSLSYFQINHEELNKEYLLLNSVPIDETEDEVIEIEYVEGEMTPPVAEDIPGTSQSGGDGPSTGGGGGHGSGTENEVTGRKGEKLVYEYLKNKSEIYPEVHWVSEYAKKESVNSDGRDGYGYDITYWDKLGNQYFVEVKSTKTNNNGTSISFHMSRNEYQVALEKGEYYQIFYVSSISGSKPKISNITFDSKSIYKEAESYLITTSLRV